MINFNEILWQFKMQKILWSVSLFLLIFISNVDAQSQQQRYELNGRILDSKLMTAIADAVVILEGTLHGTLSDSDGVFELPSVLPGTYRLMITKEGYDVLQKSIEIQNDLYVEITLFPKSRELLYRPSYLGDENGLLTQIFRYLIPRRVDAITLEYSLFNAQLMPSSLYYEGIRLIDIGSPISVFADFNNAEFVPDPFNLNLGFNASADLSTLENRTTSALFEYDSRVQKISSALTLHRDWSDVGATLIGFYDRGQNYLDGGGGLQLGGVRSGTVAARVGVQVAPRHELSGSGGWVQDLIYSDLEAQQQAMMIHYKYEDNHGFFREVSSAVSTQKLASDSEILQQGGYTYAHIAPLTNLHLKVGVNYYRYIETMTLQKERLALHSSSVNDAGIFANMRYLFSSIVIEHQIRLDMTKPHWGGATILNWSVNDQWRIITGGGYTYTDTEVTQVNLGMGWSGFRRSVDVMTFARNSTETRILGMTALVQGSHWATALNTSYTDEPSKESQLSTWMQFYATIRGPFNLFTVYPEVFGTVFHAPSWLSASCSIEWREIGGVTLQMGLHNIFDGNFSYPLSDFSEPGRSFRLTLSYQSSS